MADDIHIAEDGTQAFAGRKAAWHALGTVLPQAATMRELADAAGINWNYELTPVWFERETITDTYHHRFPGKSVITKNGIEPLGIVSDDFEFMQPSEMIGAIDEIIAAGNFKPETCLALGNGDTTVYCVNLGDWAVESNDRAEDFFVYTDCVDGRHAAIGAITTVRTVCRNTLRMGLRVAQVKLSLRHVSGHRAAHSEMVKTIIASQNRVREALTALTKVTFRRNQLANYFQDVFNIPEDAVEGNSSKAVAVRKRVAHLRDQAMDNAVKMIEEENLPLSGWVAYNAVSETIEHSGLFGGTTGTRKSLLLGTGTAAQTLDRAYQYAKLKI